MPCKCSGLRVEKCKCRIIRSGCDEDETSSVVLLTHSNSLCRLLDLKDKTKPNILLNVIEKIYEICAGYNLRYCPIRGFLRHDSYYARNAVKDLIILMCFLVANFIVFLIIVIKMMVHLYFVVTMTAQWIRRSIMSKIDTNDEMLPLSPAHMYYDYSPPITNKFL